MVSASAIIMNKDIDKGDILHRRKVKVPSGCVDFDYVLDTCVRAQTLLEVFRKFNEGTLKALKQNKDNYPYFYIAHPVIKHLAILKR